MTRDPGREKRPPTLVTFARNSSGDVTGRSDVIDGTAGLLEVAGFRVQAAWGVIERVTRVDGLR